MSEVLHDIAKVNKDTPISSYHLRGVGRPSNYKVGYSSLAFEYASLGLRQCDCAKLLGISLSTFKKWLKQHEGFEREWKRGTMLADAEVARALFKIAVGFEEKTVKYIEQQDGSYLKKVYKIYPPNLRACKLWLRNRQPGLWR